ncbi:glutathione-disulfide reductase [Bartonella sp. HY329]|uniref:glutathione-disulfide reductase n=1 Tax=unclassified Bartonella TaxID=2645622 RepID=UPI0021C89E5A|nr:MULTISPECIES: glutathione-disulfide reductase [unclassified Bartonella]UXM95900.1 glutathione-disulfide reductase [Bartonella sp. HY329]UXN10225.1 glutathione-disulfide reductase [Bartonella sp. HY328]
MSSFDFDLFVIGGGSGGVRAARLAGALGKKVGLAEEYRMGGTCVIRGCVPKKLYVYASHYRETIHDAKGFGWTINEPKFDWRYLVNQKDTEITRLEGLYRMGLENSKVTIFESRVEFVDEHTILVKNTGEKITAEKILVATGGRPQGAEQIKGGEYCISSNEVFDLPQLPKSVVIAGGGYIAVEFANIFHGLGVDTTLVYRGDLILRRFDHDLRQLLHDAMSQKGIKIIYDASIKQVAKTGEDYNVILSNGELLEAGQVMLALGRIPHTSGLGLEKAGIKTDKRGAIIVDQYLTTSNPHIWAVGDVTDRVQLTPVAIHEAMCFLQTAFHGNPTAPDHDLIPTAVFSQPEIGTVGLSEEEAAVQYANIEVYRALFRPMRNTISGNSERMLTKLIVDGDSRIVVGAHIMGRDAGELAQILGICLKGKLTKDIFDATMAVHPTAAEELVTMYKPSYSYKSGVRIDS